MLHRTGRAFGRLQPAFFVFADFFPRFGFFGLRHFAGAAGFAARSVRFARPTELFTPPPYGSFVFQTSFPSSAFTAKIQPRVLAMYMQPSATIGVPVKSPSAPACLVENVHAGESVGTSVAEMTFSSNWVRLFE